MVMTVIMTMIMMMIMITMNIMMITVIQKNDILDNVFEEPLLVKNLSF